MNIWPITLKRTPTINLTSNKPAKAGVAGLSVRDFKPTDL